MNMDWKKHAKGNNGVRRIAIPVNAELAQAIELFKQLEGADFTDSAVLQTMVEAGFKQWGQEKADEQ